MIFANPDTSTSYVEAGLASAAWPFRHAVPGRVVDFHVRSSRHSGRMVLCLAGDGPTTADTAWHEGFEGPQSSWTASGGDVQYRLLQHQRVQQDAHSGRGCEWLQIEGDGGTNVYFAHDVGRPHVIDDLTPSVWVKADHAGPQLAIRVVLPRTADPRSGQPLATILTGETYTNIGRWQQLRLTGIPALLLRQVHVLRMQLGPQVDGREAYVDAVLLNVYGGPGVTNVWIDDLEVSGFVPAAWTSNTSAAASLAPLVPVRLPPVEAERPRRTEATAASMAAHGIVPLPPIRSIKFDGSVLTINDRPIFHRVIQHRGEPLSILKKLGFNAVWLQRLPAPELLEEADRLGLWLICPPPTALTPMAEIGPSFDSVLAWDLGNDLTESDLDATQRWADQVRAADRRGNRPLVCRARTDLRGFSRAADLLLIDRRPLGTSLEFNDYATWVRQQPLLARPGTSVWTTVQTQPNDAVRQQLLALEPGSTPPLCVAPEQVRLLAYTAVAAGSRGLLFLSDSPLDALDNETRQRAMTLELLNLELDLVEPWAAAGNFVAMAESNQPQVQAAILHAEYARLLLPIWSAPMSQCVLPQSAGNALLLVAPGVPEATNAFVITPGGVQRLLNARRAGGLHVTLDEFGLTSQILLADNPVIVSKMNRRAAEVGRRWAELERYLTAYKLTTVQTMSGHLAPRMPVAQAAKWLQSAHQLANMRQQTCSRRCVRGSSQCATGRKIAAVGGTRILGRRSQRPRLVGYQPGRRQLRHAALSLAIGRSPFRQPLWPEPDCRRRF